MISEDAVVPMMGDEDAPPGDACCVVPGAATVNAALTNFPANLWIGAMALYSVRAFKLLSCVMGSDPERRGSLALLLLEYLDGNYGQGILLFSIPGAVARMN